MRARTLEPPGFLFRLVDLGHPLSFPKTENKTGFPFMVLKPASSAVVS